MTDVNDEIEQQICMRLGALIEEWGADFVCLRVPKSWLRFGMTSIGRINLQFSEEDRLAIEITHPDHAYTCYQTEAIAL